MRRILNRATLLLLLALASFSMPVLGVSPDNHIATGGSHSIIIRNNTVVAFGAYKQHQGKVPEGLNGHGRSVATGLNHSLGDVQARPGRISASEGTIPIRSDGTVRLWGARIVLKPHELNSVRCVSAGRDFEVALTNDNRIVLWGANYSGQLTPGPYIHDLLAVSAKGEWSLGLPG
jgi:hypothetical protein